MSDNNNNSENNYLVITITGREAEEFDDYDTRPLTPKQERQIKETITLYKKYTRHQK